MNDLRDVADALVASAAVAGVALDPRHLSQRDWASALFVGTRLTIELVAEESEAFEAWLIALPEAEVALDGRFVASVEQIGRRAGAATIELLLVEG